MKRIAVVVLAVVVVCGALAAPKRAEAGGPVIVVVVGVATLVTIGWGVVRWAVGCYSDAYAWADGTVKEDGPNGGWFSTSAYSAARANGDRGSHQYSTAQSEMSTFWYNGKVDVSDNALGTGPDLVGYIGYGDARGSEAKTVSSEAGGDRQGSDTVPVEFNTTVTVNVCNLEATGEPIYRGNPPIYFGTVGVGRAHVVVEAWAARGESRERSDAFWQAALIDTTATLTGGAAPTLSCTGLGFSPANFAPITQVGTTASTQLTSPVVVPIAFTVDVPAGVDTFTLVLGTDIEGNTGAAKEGPVVGMNTIAFHTPLAEAAAIRYSYMLWGRASRLSDSMFLLSDGSLSPVIVHAPGYPTWLDGHYVKATGVLGRSMDEPVLMSSPEKVEPLEGSRSHTF